MKIAITDVETTGLDPQHHEIIEIGCIIFDSETFEIEEEFTLKIKPERPEDGEPMAYKINGYNDADWADGMTLEEGMETYGQKVSGAMFCAHNMSFDYPFITEALKKTGLSNPFGKYKLCTMSMGLAKFGKVHSLKSLCVVLGIPPEDSVHRGSAGALKCYQVYKGMMQ